MDNWKDLPGVGREISLPSASGQTLWLWLCAALFLTSSSLCGCNKWETGVSWTKIDSQREGKRFHSISMFSQCVQSTMLFLPLLLSLFFPHDCWVTSFFHRHPQQLREKTASKSNFHWPFASQESGDWEQLPDPSQALRSMTFAAVLFETSSSNFF